MTSDKITMNKVVLQRDVKCRKCRTCNETLAHTLGRCVYTTVQRIRRHDEIGDFVSKKLAKMKENCTSLIKPLFLHRQVTSNLTWW